MKNVRSSVFVLALVIVHFSAAVAQKAEKKITPEFVSDTYEQLSQLDSIQDKRQWLSGQSPELKAALWQKHFEITLAENDYTTEQIEFIQKLLKAMTVELVKAAGGENAMKNPIVKDFQKLLLDGQSLFTKEQFNDIAFNIGHKIKIQKTAYSTLKPLPRYIAMPGIFREPCNCNLESACSGSCCAGTNCNKLGSNCGCFWLFECNAIKICIDNEFQ